MGNKEILDYVMNSPQNTNPSVLKGMLDSIAGDGSFPEMKVKNITTSEETEKLYFNIADIDKLEWAIGIPYRSDGGVISSSNAVAFLYRHTGITKKTVYIISVSGGGYRIAFMDLRLLNDEDGHYFISKVGSTVIPFPKGMWQVYYVTH